MNSFITVYKYSAVTKEYIGTAMAQPNPVRAGEYLLPPNTTTMEPPRVIDKGKVAVYNAEFDIWTPMPDYRGTWYNINTKEKLIIDQIGVEPTAEYTKKEPWADYVVWQNGEWVEPESHKIEVKKTQVSAKIKEYMYNAQDRVDRYRNQKDADIPTTDSADVFKSLLKYMQYLRDYNKTDKWYEQNPKTFEEWL